ncbi:MAG: hypothetical protein VYC95_09830, partial [Verrucomicrobiota bacterium]|nr:hypothetical protein [Verrucomicrobiota bacterium]
ASDPTHATTLARLQGQLQKWRRATEDPLLDQENIAHLKSEIEACIKDGSPSKARLTLTYPDYFFRGRN